MLRLLFVRHGKTDWNAQQRYQGHSDQPLNAEGAQQAQRLAARLQAEKIDLVFSSDLLRAFQTAQILVGERQINIQADERLRELNFGVLEGYTFEEGLKRWPEMITRWVEDVNQAPDGGEGYDEFSQRVSEFFNELKQKQEGKTVLVVAHGGPLREIFQSILGIPEGPAWWFSLDHGSLSDFQIDDEHIIINRINDAGHLI
ncbi:MAG TPA: alpha-ribazole phosphatase [Anaerolineales bacterium]|jgi:alpha-ribazole phosphatase